MTRRGKQVGIAMLCVAVVLVAAPWLVVQVLATGVDFDEVGVRVEAVPEEARALFWSRMGGEGEPRMPDDSSLQLLRGAWLVNEKGEAPDPSLRLAMQVALFQTPRRSGVSRKRWNFKWAVNAAWLSRHWTAAQALSVLLERADYGLSSKGLRAAALGYFNREPDGLSRAELASLIVAANRSLSPWCRPGENAAAVTKLLGRVESETAGPRDILVQTLPVPKGACPKR